MYIKRSNPHRGNTEADSIPIFNPIASVVVERVCAVSAAKLLCETLSTITPNNCGATEAPKSPPAAISANAATPGNGIISSIRINVPGQSIDEKMPTKIQAINEIITLSEMPTAK